MYFYKDFNYINYIMDLDFKDGYSLYIKCVKRIEDEAEKDDRDKHFQMFLLEVENGHTGNFHDYYKSKQKVKESYNMSYDAKVDEEQRILNEVGKLDDTKFIKKKVII